jgi:glycosyl transferase family 22 (putative mannosyltransferase)
VKARRGAGALAVILAGTAAAKIALGLFFRGYLTGDDLEIVQVAAKYAAGVTYSPWVLRCLFHPLVLVSPVMKLGVLAGASDPAAFDMLAAIPTLLFSTGTVALVAVLARRWKWPLETALAAAFLYGVAWLPLAYGASPYPRPISTAMLLGSFVLATAASPRRAVIACFAAGGLAGAAFAVRWSEGVVLVPLVAWTYWRFRDWRRCAAIAAGFAAGACLCAGLVDWLTWGKPFASLFAFVRIMWLEIPQARLAREEGFGWYFYSILRWLGPILLLLILYGLRNRRGRAALLLGTGIVVLMSCFAHKEWRYLQAAIPFLAMAAASGWERLRERGFRAVAAAAMLLCVPYGIERAAATLGDRVSSGLAAARYIRAMRPQPRVLALEQTWAWGEHLWLGNRVEIREIEYNKPFRSGAIRLAAAGADVVGAYAQHFDRACLRELAALGFRPLFSFPRGKSFECSLFGRGAFAPAPRPPENGSDGGAGTAAPAPPLPPASTPPPARGTP